jgi:alpha-ketoglutarate-dependent taurine dioxygenase
MKISKKNPLELKQYIISEANHKNIYQEFINDWKDKNLKVFTFKLNFQDKHIRDYYDSFFSDIGEFLPYAEDGRVQDRSRGRTGEIWMEVRNIASVKNAYRHSTNAQPLHTDGSYIPKFPTSIMVCMSNVDKGGETIFVDINSVLKDLKSFNKKLYDSVTSEEILHERSGESRISNIFYVQDDILKVNFNYYCVSGKNPVHISKFTKQLLDYFVLIEKDQRERVNVLKIKLETGDCVIWKDDEILHGRKAFFPSKDSERFLWKAVYQPNF